MMKASEIRELTAEELSAKLGELKKDLFNLRLQLATNQLDNTNKINEVKHRYPREADRGEGIREGNEYYERKSITQNASRQGRFR